MRLLLDTHIALWAIDAPARLSQSARQHIEAAEEVSVSTVSIWEIAVKHALRRGRHDDIVISGGDARDRFIEVGFSLLPITPAHAAALDDIPLLHSDPFDRMLIAQALTEPMRLITHDSHLKNYGALVTMV